MRMQSPASLVIEAIRYFSGAYLKHRNFNLLIIPKHTFLQYKKEIHVIYDFSTLKMHALEATKSHAINTVNVSASEHTFIVYYYVPIPVGAMRGQMVKESKEKPGICSHILVQPALPKAPLLL